VSPLKARGFTLIELLVALVLLGIVSAGIYQTLNTSQRTFIGQTQRIDLQQNIRAGATILPGEFRLLDSYDGDISVMTGTQITMRAIRKLGFICNPPVLGGGLGQVNFTIRAQPFFGGSASFAVNDSVLVFDEGNPSTRNDDSWVAGQVKGVGATTCPDSGGTTPPGYVLTLAPQWLGGNVNVANAITNGSPVFGFITVSYGLFQNGSDSRWYVGDSGSYGGWIPLIGPLIGSNGLTLSYYDTLGNVTAVPTHVASIGIVLRAETAVPVRSAYTGTTAYQVDSVITRVALRNNPRCGPPLGPCQ
jgi:prepilin-type N-terminal cleavage/methylation domain-containing protein